MKTLPWYKSHISSYVPVQVNDTEVKKTVAKLLKQLQKHWQPKETGSVETSVQPLLGTIVSYWRCKNITLQGVQHRTIYNVRSTKPKNWFKCDLCATLIRAIIIASKGTFQKCFSGFCPFRQGSQKFVISVYPYR